MRFTVKTISLVVASAFVAFGCGKEEPKQQAPAPQAAPAAPPPLVVKIGHVGPLTGGIAHLGKDNENGARLAVDEANAAGIKLGGKNVTFELLAEDDQADPKVGTTVAQKLVDAKVAGVVGHLNSGTTIPASAVYNQAGIPMISGSATNPQLTEQGFKNVVPRRRPRRPAGSGDRQLPRRPVQAEDRRRHRRRHRLRRRPRQRSREDAQGGRRQGAAAREGHRQDHRLEGGPDQDQGQEARRGVLRRHGRHRRPAAEAGARTGIKAVFSFGDGACTDKMTELAGAAAEGLLCSQAGIPVQAAGKKFLDAYKAKFKIDPILYAPFTYDAANLLIAAMKKADSAEPAKYLPELSKISYNGASGEHRVRRERRPQGRRDDDLHHERRQDSNRSRSSRAASR